jgi:predicted Zn-dependent protease
VDGKHHFVASLEKERELGAQYFATVERSARLIRDPEIIGYLTALAQNIERNSDAHMPITVVVVDSKAMNACTSQGGYQYVTRGLLVHMETEGELAAVLSHGVAYTALHSPARQQLRQALITIDTSTPATIPVFTCTSNFPLLINSALLQDDEFDADYFGVQYLYKSGYDPESYLDFVQRIWPADRSSKGQVAFSPFPPTYARLKTLRKEISDVLSPRGQSVGSTSAFDEFQGHLRRLAPPPPEPDQPVLIRHNSEE